MALSVILLGEEFSPNALTAQHLRQDAQVILTVATTDDITGDYLLATENQVLAGLPAVSFTIKQSIHPRLPGLFLDEANLVQDTINHNTSHITGHLSAFHLKLVGEDIIDTQFFLETIPEIAEPTRDNRCFVTQSPDGRHKGFRPFCHR